MMVAAMRSAFVVWRGCLSTRTRLQPRFAALEQLFLQPEVLEQTGCASGGRWENMQCLKYAPGGEYLPHYDADERVPRMLTVILYLNGEGETWFPLALQEACDAQALENAGPPPQATLAAAVYGQLDPGHHGLLLRPGKGDAVAFYNLLNDGSRQLDPRSLHAGLPALAESASRRCGMNSTCTVTASLQPLQVFLRQVFRPVTSTKDGKALVQVDIVERHTPPRRRI